MENMENVALMMGEDNGCVDSGCGSDGYGTDCDSECGFTNENWHPSFSRFWKTKQYLHRVRDEIRRCTLLEQRINLRLHDSDGSEFPDTNELDDELLNAEERVNNVKIEVTDLISKLPDVNQQMVITERYVNLKTWERIAQEMCTSVRIVQKIHGRALPLLEKLIMESQTEDDCANGE